jgi:hypothetical protein
LAVTVAWLNAEEGEPAYAAAQLRNLTVALLAGSTRQAGHTRSGVRITSGHDLEATLNPDGTEVTVAPGSCVIDGAASTQGAYAVLVDEPVTREVPEPHATLHRIDAVFVRVLDADVDASGDKRALVAYAPGEPASAPQPPVLPATALLLGYVAVPPADAGPPTVTDQRPWLSALGGVIRCTSTRRPRLVPSGTLAYEADTGKLLVSRGDAWTAVDDPTGATWTNLTLPTAFVTDPSTGVIPAWRRETGWVNLRGRIRRRDGQLMSGEIRNVLRLPESLWPGATYAFGVGAHYRSSSVTARIEVRSADGWIWGLDPRRRTSQVDRPGRCALHRPRPIALRPSWSTCGGLALVGVRPEDRSPARRVAVDGFRHGLADVVWDGQRHVPACAH